MPLKKYNRYFGGDAAAAMQSMVDQYGPVKGKQVFYATMNKHKKKRTLKAAAGMASKK